jgi:hypothetical protein
VKIDGATHWGAAFHGGDTYIRALREFVATAQAVMRDGSLASAYAADAATTAVELH